MEVFERKLRYYKTSTGIRPFLEWFESLKDAKTQTTIDTRLYHLGFQDGDQKVFLLALRDVVEGYGIGKLAKRTHISREHFYRMLSKGGNPQWDTL